jgi:hypothetical protein
MNKVKYTNQKTGEQTMVKVTQCKASIDSAFYDKHLIPGVTLAHANRQLLRIGYIRSGRRCRKGAA